MRYNDEKYLLDWQQNGNFPQIHDDLFQLIVEEARGFSFAEVCCSHGMLSTRVLQKLPKNAKGASPSVVAFERDEEALRLARLYNVPVTIHPMTIDARSLSTLANKVQEAGATVLLARRCYSELFAYPNCENPISINAGFATEFHGAMYDAGIREIFLQGRAVSRVVTHPIPSIDVECQIATNETPFAVRVKRGQCAYLRVKPSAGGNS